MAKTPEEMTNEELLNAYAVAAINAVAKPSIPAPMGAVPAKVDLTWVTYSGEKIPMGSITVPLTPTPPNWLTATVKQAGAKVERMRLAEADNYMLYSPIADAVFQDEIAATGKTPDALTLLNRLICDKEPNGYPLWFNRAIHECPGCDSEDLCMGHHRMAERNWTGCETEITKFRELLAATLPAREAKEK